MKKLILLSVTILIGMSCTKMESKFPVGAWKQYSNEYYIDGKLAESSIVNYYSMKLFSEKNWEFIQKITTDSVTNTYYGSGSYTLNGNEYSEKIEVHYLETYEGRTLKMTLELKNDTLVQSWIPLDSLGNLNAQYKLVEKYIRLQ